MDATNGEFLDDEGTPSPLPMFGAGVRVFDPRRGIGEVLAVDTCDGCPTIRFDQSPPTRFGWQEFRDADVIVLGHPIHAASA